MKSGETSKKIAKKAAKFLRMTDQEFAMWKLTSTVDEIREVIVSFAASLLTQAPMNEKKKAKKKKAKGK